MNVIENIKRIRLEKGITQNEISELIGLAQNNYGKLERGITELTISRLYQIADILGVSVLELLGEAQTDTSSKEIESLKKRILELEEQLLEKKEIFKIVYKMAEALIEQYNERVDKENKQTATSKYKKYPKMPKLDE